MNKYGVRAKAHWEKYLPARTAALEDPQEFFTNLGEQVSDLVTATVEDLEVQHAQQIKEADYLTRVGLLTTLQQQAEEIALAEPRPRKAKGTAKRRAPPGGGSASLADHPL